MTVTEEHLNKWSFFCREVAKAHEILDLIEDLWGHIEMRDNAYNQIFSLIIDSLTTKVFLHIGHLFDSQDDALRLSRVITDKADQAILQNLKSEAVPFLQARNREHAHLSKFAKEINYGSNFRLMNEKNAKKIREILEGVGVLLRKWGIANNDGGVIADRWGNVSNARELLFEALEEHEFILSEMSTVEHIELTQRMKEEK